MDRQIVCLRIPSFEIALARLEDPALRGHPVAVTGTTHPRAALREVSPEGTWEGLFPGMALDQARWLCPSLRVLPASAARVRRAHRAVVAVIGEFAPVWEPAGPGHVFADLTGTQRLFGRAVDAASRIGRELARRQQLDAALGVGSNKLVTDVATTLVAPSELRDVPPGDERPFMAPLPPQALPELARPSGRLVLSALNDLNLTTLGAIADVPVALLSLVAGTAADDLHRHAQGIDATAVTAPRSRPRLEESITLDPDTVEMATVRAHLLVLVERMCRMLRSRAQTCRRIRLTIVHSDFIEVVRDADVQPAGCLEGPLFSVADELLARGLRRRVRVRRLILEGDVTVQAHEQLPLFSPRMGEHANGATPPAAPGSLTYGTAAHDLERVRRLTDAIDRIRARHGEKAVRWGRGIA